MPDLEMPRVIRSALSRAWRVVWGMLLAAMLLPAAGALGQVTPPPARSFVWDQVDVTVELREDSSFHVTERNAVAFTGGPFRTGYREIPLARVEGFDHVRVGEVEGAYVKPYRFVAPGEFSRETPNTYTWQKVGPNLRIEWSIPETTSETRTFQLEYDAYGALRVYANADPPYQQISWVGVDTTLTETAPVNAASLTFVLPRAIDLGRARLAGPGGFRPVNHTDDGQTWVWRANDLGPGESLEAALRFPPLVDAVAPAWQEASDRAEAGGAELPGATPVPSGTPVAQATPVAGSVDIPPCREVMANDFPGRRRQLIADCVTDRPIFVPESWVFDGGGHTIYARDPEGGRLTGGVVTVSGDGSTVRNLTIDGSRLTAPCLVDGGATFVAGVLVSGDTGEVSGVTIRSINRTLPGADETTAMADRKSCGIGIAVLGAGTGVIVDRNDVFDAGAAGIWVEGGAASLAHNSVERAAIGVLAIDGGHVRISPGNQIRNGHVGIQIEGWGSGGRIAGNTIEAMSLVGISLLNGAQVAAVDNTLRHTGVNGIAIEGPLSRATVEDNHVEDSGVGIKVWQGAAEVRGNAVAGGDHGIVGSGGARAIIAGNTVRNTSAHGIFALHDGTQATIEDNTVTDSGQHGISISNGSMAVNGNVVTGSAEDGILIADGAEASIGENRVSGGERGIEVGGAGATATVLNNTVERVDVVGITINRSATAPDVSGNTVSEARFGIVTLGAGTTSTVADNTVSDLSGSGFTVEDGATAELRGNHVSHAPWGIIVTSAGTTADLVENRIERTNTGGISVEDGAQATVVGNTLLHPGVNGIETEGAGHVTLEENTIEDARSDGIRLERERTASAVGASVELVSRDIFYEPREIIIPAETDVTLVLPNEGAAAHNVTIEDLGIDVDLAPGQAEEVVVNAPVGTYEIFCNVPGHREAGHVATLRAEPGLEAGADPEPVEPDVIRDNEISGGENGIVVTGSGAIAEVTMNSIAETSGTGIAIAGGATSTVETNLVIDAGLGIDVVRGGTSASLTGNRITDTVERGIKVQSGAEATLHENVVMRAGTTGIYVDGQGTTAMLTGNVVSNATEEGIKVERAAAATITDENTVIGGKWGIAILSDGTTAEVRGNRVRAVSNQGISVVYGAYATVADNTVSGGDRGIYVRNPRSSAVITGNFVNAEEQGIYVWEEATAERIEDNTVTGGRFGIVIKGEGVQAVVEENRVSGFGSEGIAVRDGATADIIGNRVQRNRLTFGGWGVNVAGQGAAATIAGNEISEINGIGIQVGQGATGTVRDNTVSDVEYTGIRVIDAVTGVVVSGNTLREAGTTGIEGRQSDVAITGNTIAGSSFAGIQLGIDAVADVTGNTIVGPEASDANDPGPYGIHIQRHASGQVTDNRISRMINDGAACAIHIDANAPDIRVADNHFPPPGNDRDVCDERLSAPAATPAPVATPIAAAPCLDPAELDPNVEVVATRTTILQKAPTDASPPRPIIARGTRLLVAPSITTSGSGAEDGGCGWIPVVVIETGQPGFVPADHVQLAAASDAAAP